MIYLVNADQKKLFSDQVYYLKKFFLSADDWVFWRIVQQKPDLCNASLDDLRITYALVQAGRKWNQPEYIALGLRLAAKMKIINLRDNYFVEAYCEPPPQISNKVDLSYLDLPAMKFLTQYDKDWHAVLYRSQKLLVEGKTKTGFYFDKYFLDKQRYGLQDMNLINQLICALTEMQSGEKKSKLYDWLKNEYLKKGLIYGRYHPQTLKPLVNFESPAVYGLMLSLAVRQEDNDFAEKLKVKLLKTQNKNGSFGISPYEAFDHILILTALHDYQTFVQKSKLLQ